MVFSSFSFLFVFLPLVLICYFVCQKRRHRNFVLLIFSLLFYSWGEPIYILIMFFSTFNDYWHGKLIDKYRDHKNIATLLLISSIVINLGLLCFFKYSDFLITNINYIFHTQIQLLNLPLPIGISFYTFQTMSYSIDIYKGHAKPQKSIIDFGMYVTLFPQLVAGPIVRYETIATELKERKETVEDISFGMKRFIIGLGKKVIIANHMGLIADTIYNGEIAIYGTGILWLAAIAYTLQIYFDFSGYSDMAIGLGRIFGFHFLENFHYPYMATSITDFWRRWHISLSSWFRDYVYIPLGGNRVGQIKWLRNILIVWLLTGLWHGASWNYVLWGGYYGLLLILEKFVFHQWLEKIPTFIKHIYTMFFVIIGWVIFRIENFSDMSIIFSQMFSLKISDFINDLVLSFDIISSLPYLFIGIIACFPLIRYFKKYYYSYLYDCYVIIVLVICIVLLLNSTYNPFIYFQF